MRWILIYKTKKVSLRYAQVNIKRQTLYIAIIRRFQMQERKYATFHHRRSQYEANRGTRLGKILPNTVNFYFFYQTDNIRRFHTADFVQRTVCSPRL